MRVVWIGLIVMCASVSGQAWAQVAPTPQAPPATGPSATPPSTPGATSPRSAPLPDMSAIAKALGVACGHCHVAGNFASDANPKKVIARQMLVMTDEINARIEAAAGRAAGGAARVRCVTCHRGQPVPRTLTEALVATIAAKGNDAVADEYRTLRRQFYGRDTFDFGEQEFVAFCFRLAEGRPDAAIPLIRAHLEFNPQSTSAYIALSRAYVTKRDTQAAIAVLRKALELEPDNGLVQGYLAQLEPRR